MITLKWYGKQVQALVDKSANAGILASAITLENAIVNKINSMGIVDTGRYKGSITYKTKQQKSTAEFSADNLISVPKLFQAIVGTALYYAPYLEYGHKRGKKVVPPRPAIRRSWDESKVLLQTVFNRQFKKIFNSVKI